MENTHIQKRKGYFALGGAGLLLSIGYTGMSLQMPFGEMSMPGAALFPIVVGVLLLVSSLSTIWEGLKMEQAELVEIPTGAGRKRLLILIGAMFLYFIALSWLGFIISSVLFTVVLMRTLSDSGYTRILVYSLIMSFAIYGGFVYLLKVPMPRGVLGF
jgi:hypothetical protein